MHSTTCLTSSHPYGVPSRPLQSPKGTARMQAGGATPAEKTCGCRNTTALQPNTVGLSHRGSHNTTRTKTTKSDPQKILPRPNHHGILELLHLAVEIEDLGHDDIHADGNFVAVVVKTVPENAALLPHQFAFGKVMD